MDKEYSKSHTGGNQVPELPPDAEARVILEARKEGVFAGLTSGLASAIIGFRLFGLKRNVSFFCGALSGVLAGYFFTKGFKDTALAQLRAEEARLQLRQQADNPEIMPDSTRNHEPPV